jgi:translation initiation factor IF-3
MTRYYLIGRLSRRRKCLSYIQPGRFSPCYLSIVIDSPACRLLYFETRSCSRSLSIADHRINHQIRAREVLLIDAEGVKRGIIAYQDALREAEEAGLDLVEVAGTVSPPVCRIMDYGKMAYQAKKKKTVSKGSQDMKELSFSMKISEHDIETKVKRGREFIEKGHKLKLNLILRGRERSYAATNGLTQIKRIAQKLSDVAQVEQMSDSMVGNRLYAVLVPLKVKAVVAHAPAAPADPPAQQ